MRSEVKENKHFWSKIRRKEQEGNANWINNMKKELRWIKESSKTSEHLNSLKAILKENTKVKNTKQETIPPQQL